MRFALALAIALAGCGPRHPDVVEPDVCRSMGDAPLPEGSGDAARYVVRGRVRFTAAAVDFDGDKRTDYRYAVVDVLDVRRGDPWKILPHFRRSFPLLERDSAPGMVAALRCREGQAFLFYVDLPNQERATEVGVPDPVARSFAAFAVKLYAVRPDEEVTR